MIRPRHFVLLFFFASILGFSFQGSRGLYEPTEGRYAEMGREMVESGDWWVPQLDHEPHLSKPPLTYWGIAAGIALVGPTALGARLVNAVAFPFLVLCVAWLGALLWTPEIGLLSGLVYATSLFPVAAASTITTDLLLTLWEVLAAALYWKAVRSAELARSDRWWIMAFWVVVGLGFLTKGPPALLTLLAILVFHGVGLRRGWVLPRLVNLPGLLGFIVVGFGWYLDVVLRVPGLLGYFLGEEVLGRVATDQFNRHPQWYGAPFAYGPSLALGLGGWLLQMRGIRRGLRKTGVEMPLRRALTAGPVRFFLSLWFILPLILLSLSMSRLPLYVLPFFAVLALGTARALARALPLEDLRKRVAWTSGVMAILILGLKAGSALVPSGSDMSALSEAIVRLSAQATGSPLSETLPTTAERPPLVVVVDEPALYGLEFYLGETVARVRSVEEGAGDYLPDFLAAAMKGGESDRFIFVARGNRAVRAEPFLCDTSGLVCQEEPGHQAWRLWVTTRKSNPTPLPGGV